MFANLSPPKAAGKENKQKVQKQLKFLKAAVKENKQKVQNKLKFLKAAGKENTQQEPVKDKSQVQKKLTCLRCCQCATCKRKRFSTKRIEIVLYDPRNEIKQNEPVKDKSQVQKKRTCPRCCQCATCKRKRFSTKRIEIVLYDPRHLLDAKSTNSNTPSDEPVTRSPPPDLIPYLSPQASSCCGTTPVFSRLRHPAKSRQTMVLRNILRHVQNALVLSSALLVILVLQRLVHYEHHEFDDVMGEEPQHGDAMGHGCKAGLWTRVSYRTQSESGIYEYSSAN